MATHERSVTTKAAPEAVWRIWSDTSTWPTWNPDVQSVQLDGPFATGTTGVMSTKQATHKILLANVVNGRSFALVTSPIPLTKFSFQCRVTPQASGGSEIAQGLAMSGPLSPIFSPMMGPRIADTFPALLKGLAGAAEAAGS